MNEWLMQFYKEGSAKKWNEWMRKETKYNKGTGTSHYCVISHDYVIFFEIQWFLYTLFITFSWKNDEKKFSKQRNRGARGAR